jgi:hypothetical protein
VRVSGKWWLTLWASVLIGMLPEAIFAQIAAPPSSATAEKFEEEPLWEAVVDPTAILAQVRFFDFLHTWKLPNKRANQYFSVPTYCSGRAIFAPASGTAHTIHV